MLGIFGRRGTIVCPRCLSKVSVDPNKPKETRCTCDYLIPMMYVRDYPQAMPVYIQMFGWSKAGKSTWLDMLRLHLYNIENVWPESFTDAVTQIDIDHKQILRTERLQGRMPGATPKKDRDQNQVYLNLVKHMQRWGSRFLVIVDHAGEMFEKLDVPVKEIPFLVGTPTAIMLVCLPDMYATGKTFYEVVQIYVRALENYGVNLKKANRRLVIVFSKADLITSLPANLREYLETDDLASILPPYSDRFEFTDMMLAEYLERMARVSDAIRNWVDTSSVEGGRSGLSLLKENNIDARFVIMSSTGQDMSTDGGKVELKPRRVLDPFFWALEFQSRDR
jgi:hypothetical protein